MKIAFLIIFILLFYSPNFGLADKAYEQNVEKWHVISPPPRSDWKNYNEFMILANYSKNEWVVRNENGKVLASLRDESKTEKEVMPSFDTTFELQCSKGPATLFEKVDDGWIAAYNKGEFGSAVFWFDENGKHKRKLSEHHINEFIVDRKRIFAVEGLAHRGMSKGSMIELRKMNGQWISEEFIPLPGSGEAIAKVSSGDYVIVTSDMLLRVNLDREVKILIPNGDWGGFYPNSVSIDNKGYIFIGMRQFVIRSRLGQSIQTFEYMVPNQSWLNKSKK